MKKKKSQKPPTVKKERAWFGPVAMIILLSLFFVWPLFLPTFYRTHDDFDHLITLQQFFTALHDGQLFVRWLPDLMGGYGLPAYIIYPPLSSYISAFFDLLGFGLFSSFKTVFILTFIFSGIAMFFYAKEYFENKSAFLAAVAYMLAPFHLLDIYVRGAFNEIQAFIFIPLIFLGIKRVSDTGYRSVPLLALSTAGLALSHSISTMLTLPWAVLYGLVMIVTSKRFTNFIHIVFGSALGLGLSSIYWLVAFVEKDLTTVGTDIGAFYFDFSEHFIRISELLAPSWDYGYSGIDEPYKMSFQIGTLYILSLIISFIAVRKIKDRPIRTNIIFLQFMALCCIFMTLKWSKPLWDFLPLISYAQFPWRFLILLAFPLAFMTGMLCYIVKEIPEWQRLIRVVLLIIPAVFIIPFYIIEKSPDSIELYTLELGVFAAGAAAIAAIIRGKSGKTEVIVKTAVAMLVLTSLLYANPALYYSIWKRPHIIKDTEKVERMLSAVEMRKKMGPGTKPGEASLPRMASMSLPKTVSDIPRRPPGKKVETVRGDTFISYLRTRSDAVIFNAEAVTDSELRINTFYFPGWNAYIDGERTTTEHDNSGRIHIRVPKGNHTIMLSFEDTPIRKKAKLISFISLFILMIWTVLTRKKKTA